MDPEDLEAIDERIARGVSIAAASAVRVLAATMRSQAELAASQARTLDDLADDIESGRAEPPASAVKLAVVPVEGEAADKEEEQPVPIARVTPSRMGNAELLFPEDDSGLFEKEMKGWLDLFADRIKMSPFFVEAVNEAADNGLPATMNSARLVADHVAELTEMSRRSEGDG